MSQIDIKIHKWSDVTLNEYDKILELNNEDISEAEKEIAILAIMCRVPEEDIWNMQLEDINQIRGSVDWINNFDYPKKIQFKKIKVGSYTCTVDVNLQHFTVAQYVDFQTYFKDMDKYRAELLSVFFIPEGKKYNDGYDITDLVKEIKENVDIVTFNSVCFFFLRTYQILINNTLNSLDWTMKMKCLFSKGTVKKKWKETRQMVKDLKASMDLHGYL